MGLMQDPQIGLLHRNKARFVAILIIGSIITLITFIVLSFLDSNCKKNKMSIVTMMASACSLSLFYAKVIHKHVSFKSHQPPFTGINSMKRQTEFNQLVRIKMEKKSKEDVLNINKTRDAMIGDKIDALVSEYITPTDTLDSVRKEEDDERTV